jgi:thymidine kinase
MLPGLQTPGYLGLISGCMFSGKTSKLIELFKQYTMCEISVSVINHAGDDRYGTSELSTHDGRQIPCTRATSLSGLENHESIKNSRVVLINEGQFFPDIVPWVTARVEDEEKIVFVCGLDGDFARQGFGSWLDLLPLADEVTKLTALCSSCKLHPGIFSRRLTADTHQVLIGSAQYIPVCRRCYKMDDIGKAEKIRASMNSIREKIHQRVKNYFEINQGPPPPCTGPEHCQWHAEHVSFRESQQRDAKLFLDLEDELKTLESTK